MCNGFNDCISVYECLSLHLNIVWPQTINLFKNKAIGLSAITFLFIEGMYVLAMLKCSIHYENIHINAIVVFGLGTSYYRDKA